MPKLHASSRHLLIGLVFMVLVLVVGISNAGAQGVQTTLGMVDVVKDFAAVGDGCADDTQALQDALDHAAQTGAGVYLPAGVYRVTSTLEFHHSKQIHIQGAGPSATIISPDVPDGHYVFDIHPKAQPGSTDTCAPFLEDFRIKWLLDDTYVDRCQFYRQAKVSRGIRIQGVSGSSMLRNVRFTGAPSVALHLNSTDGSEFYRVVEWMSISGCWFEGSGKADHEDSLVLLGGEAKVNQIWFENCVFHGKMGTDGAPRTLLEVGMSDQVVVHSSKFSSVKEKPVILFGDVPAPDTQDRGTGNVIMNNGFEGIRYTTASPSAAAIVMYGAKGKAEAPVIAFNSFVVPAKRDVFLHNISYATVMEPALKPHHVHVTGEGGSDNHIMALGYNPSPGGKTNQYFFPDRHGYTIMNGLKVTSSRLLAEENDSWDPADPDGEQPYISWSLDADTLDKEQDASTKPGAVVKLANEPGDSPATSKLSFEVGKVETMVLEPGRATVEGTLGAQRVEAPYTQTVFLETAEVRLRGPHLIDATTMHTRGAVQYLEVFDKNGVSLGFIPILEEAGPGAGPPQ